MIAPQDFAQRIAVDKRQPDFRNHQGRRPDERLRERLAPVDRLDDLATRELKPLAVHRPSIGLWIDEENSFLRGR